MTDRETGYRLARAYLAHVAKGELPDELLAPDMTGWITSGGTMDKVSYQNLVRLLGAMLDGELRFTVHSMTAEEDRVAVEARSEGRLVNGESYEQTYVFIFRIRDGKIAAVAEHYNALIAERKLVPLMPAAREKLATT